MCVVIPLYAKENFMHKLFYTAAIPLLVGGSMAMDFANTVEGTGSNASSRAAFPVEEKSDDVGTVLQNDVLTSNRAEAQEIPASGAQVNVFSLALITVADATQSTGRIPNLAANATEEEATHVGAASIAEPSTLDMNKKLTIRFQLAPDSHLEDSTRPLKPCGRLKNISDIPVSVDLILAPGNYDTGEQTYTLVREYDGTHPAINSNADSSAFITSTELVATEDGRTQLTLKLTITKAFTVTENEEKEDLPPAPEEAPYGDNDDESSEEDDTL